MRIKHLIGVLVLVSLVAALAAAPSARQTQAQDVVTVKFGNLPYLDYSPWALAEELGYLEEEGIKLDPYMFEVEQPMVEALIGGSIDVGAGSDTPFIILAAAAPELRLVSVHVIFTGYSIMGRPDEVKTYDQFVAEGMTHEEAVKAAAAQLEGKTIILPGGASFTPVLDTALGYAGLTRDDVEIIDIDPVEGAAAFIQGTADFYSDGLPQRFRLEQEGMVNVLTGVQLAGGAMVFAGLYTTDEYLADHPEVIEGMLRAWYRTMDYLRANPDEALPVMVDWINEQSGAGFTVEDAKRFTQDLVLFPTYEEVRDEYMYNPESPFYWEKRLQFVVDYFGETEGLDTTAIDLKTLVPAPDIFPNVEPPAAE
jgi:ABC-type nitrate/sulfonate/bicarbonate transport system substrate-binding protein